jgi:UDP-N-acetylglucosamine 1-carboxyvinyltransferase
MHQTEHIEIAGGRPLTGTLTVSGAKNAALPIMAASLLTQGRTTLTHVPRLRDVETMAAILRELGVNVRWTGPNTMTLEPTALPEPVAPGELVREMRGSICVLGPLLATRGVAGVPLPGGCVIGERPIDLHLKGLRALGASIQEQEDLVIARADGLRGAEMNLCGQRGSTVTGTANVLMAAALARGRTIIRRAAREPEVQDLCHYLVACGARIEGIGTDRLIIDGVDRLHGTEHRVVPDRIEAGTLLVAAAATRGSIILRGACPDHMAALLECLREIGATVEVQGKTVRLAVAGPLEGVDIETAPHPGLPTDMQPQLSALLCTVDGRSIVHENVYPDRTTHVPHLSRMGAQVVLGKGSAMIEGVPELRGAAVHADDLRSGAALVIAGLTASGTTTITGLDQLDRGYQRLEPRLRKLGADIRRVDKEAERRSA